MKDHRRSPLELISNAFFEPLMYGFPTLGTPKISDLHTLVSCSQTPTSATWREGLVE